MRHHSRKIKRVEEALHGIAEGHPGVTLLRTHRATVINIRGDSYRMKARRHAGERVEVADADQGSGDAPQTQVNPNVPAPDQQAPNQTKGAHDLTLP